MLGCRLEPGHVWINNVGTFGVASASYWWSRVISGVCRAMYALLGGAHHLDLLVFADDMEFLAIDRQERLSILLAVVILLALGVPFKWAKFRGGFRVGWVGYGVCYQTFAMGLTDSRAQWVADWTGKLVSDGRVSVAEMRSGVGRLNYAAQALYYERAFLGIIYLWVSSIVSASVQVATIPWAVRLILQWIGRRMSDESALKGRLQVVPNLDLPTVEWFRTDAKAEDGEAWIGGWEVNGTNSTMESRWFAMQITKEQAPWVFAKAGDPQRVIAALELLASMVAMVLFDPDCKRGGPMDCVLTGITDNRGNAFIVSKLSSTKWPITTLLIELSEQLRARGAVLNLVWRRREENKEADALTNQEYSGFNMQLRVGREFGDIKWRTLDELITTSSELYRMVVSDRAANKHKPQAKSSAIGTVKKRGMKWSDPW